VSVKGFLKDLAILSAIIWVIFFSGFMLYLYFTTDDPELLYLGVFLLFIGVFGALARYRYIIDYVWTLLRKWR
jgi:hypothetical protein